MNMYIKNVLKQSVLMLMMLGLPFFFTCCDNDATKDIPSIVGHWHSVSVSSTHLNTSNGATVDYLKEDKSLELKLYDDGTCVYNSFLGTYKVLSNELDFYIRLDNTDIVVSYHYTIEELKPTMMVISTFEYIEKGSKKTKWKITYNYRLERLA